MKPRIEFNDQKFDGHNTKKGGIDSFFIGLRWERDENASAELRYKRKRWSRSKKTKLLIKLSIFCVKNKRLIWKEKECLLKVDIRTSVERSQIRYTTNLFDNYTKNILTFSKQIVLESDCPLF